MAPTDLAVIGTDVEWPAHEAAAVVREAVAERAELGRLAELAEWVAGVRPGAPDAAGFGRVRTVVLGGEATQLAEPIATAGSAGMRVVADLGGQVPDALEAGAALADAEIDSGADLLVVACPGLRTDAAVAVAVLTNSEPVKVLRRGSAAADPQAWMASAIEVRDGRRRCVEHRDHPDRLLVGIGSARLAFSAALVLRAAARRTPVLLDGPYAAAAALVAYEAQPRAVRWWAAADLGPEPLQELALSRIGQRPILGLGSGLGDGLAGALALPVVQAAAALASRVAADAARAATPVIGGESGGPASSAG